MTDKLIYIDAPSGLAGDMLLAALLDAGGDEQRLLSDLRRLDLGDWQLSVRQVKQQGLAACDVTITYPQQHSHRHLADIETLITAAAFPPRAEQLALSAFQLLAAAEATAHGCPLEQVHFHEVGAVDSLLDICGVMLLIDQLHIRSVYCSPLPLSSGYVDCEHGRMPVPAPAAAELLRGFRLVPSAIKGEAITPTGAALLKALEARQTMPDFILEQVGRGAGKRQLAEPNMVRLLLGREAAAESGERDMVEVLHANLDDCSGEMMASLWEQAFARGALDLCFTPLLMKKGRPAWQVQLMVPAGRAAEFAALLLAETTTLGCRISRESRVKAPRRSIEVSTAYGPVRVVVSGHTVSPEAESVRQAAERSRVPFKQVWQAALAAALATTE